MGQRTGRRELYLARVEPHLSAEIFVESRCGQLAGELQLQLADPVLAGVAEAVGAGFELERRLSAAIDPGRQLLQDNRVVPGRFLHGKADFGRTELQFPVLRQKRSEGRKEPGRQLRRQPFEPAGEFSGQVGQLAFSRKICASEIGVAAFERKGEIPQIPVEIPPDFDIEPGQDLGQFEFPPFPATRAVVDPPAAEQ